MNDRPTIATIDSEADLMQWLDASPNRERSGDFRGLRLDAMRAVLGRLPRPPAPLTIAGTKGKGSTLRLCEMALLAGGAATVTFTSPHLCTVRERWRIDGVPASLRELADAAVLVSAAERACAQVLSWFERTVAMAAVIAAARPRAFFLCEIGIGGRCDAVNAFDPALTVITQLSFDHRDVLGPTMAHIAAEKFGITRAGVPLVIAPQGTEATLALQRLLHHAPPLPVLWAVRGHERLALLGEHQQDNAATARAALAIAAPGLDPAPGFAQAQLAGRCQLIEHRGRRVLIDGAHNGPSVAATIAVARAQLREDFCVVLAAARDKEIEPILAAIPRSVALHRCAYGHPRARQRDAWPSSVADTPWHAEVSSALDAISGDLCITGSLYLAGEALLATGHGGALVG